MQQPPVITYNLNERGRSHRGTERHFDIPSIVAAINSPACQERVATRGMLGYLGHWPRIRFGMEPPEGGLFDGKAHAVEPAVVTVYLRAHPNGDIEHRTEFLDTPPGAIAARMYANRVGGFSSAIDTQDPELYGFDWVNDPNYSTNRGYQLALDSAADGGLSFVDALMAEQQEQLDSQTALMAAMERNMELALDSAARLEQDNNELLELLASANRTASDELAASVFDSAATMKQGEAHKGQMARDRAFFLDAASLPAFLQPETDSDIEQAEADREYLSL
ncbi:MAG: hypothetical protein ACRC8Q_08135, partial [Aeromonas sp.]